MAILKIARMGHPILRKKARQLTLKEVRSTEIRRFVDNMIETMRDANGLGLAAPQVHNSIQLAVIEFDPSNPRYKNSPVSDQPLLVIVNPVVKVLDQTLQGFWEGCLSVPGLRGFVQRPKKIQINYLDLEGQKKKLIASNFLATVFQHELDHLNGQLYVDHILPQDRERFAFIEEYQRYWTQPTES